MFHICPFSPLRAEYFCHLKAQRSCAAIIVDLEHQHPAIRSVARAGVSFRRLLVYSVNPDQEPTRWRDVGAFACADFENQLVFCPSQRVASRTELTMLVLKAVAVILVERERPVVRVEVQRQRVERALIGVAQVWPTRDDGPRTNV